MTVYSFLLHFHSITRWLLLIGLVISILAAVYNYLSKKQTGKTGRLVHFLTGTLSHIQLLLGFVLYFVSPKVIFSSETMKHAGSRFYTMEHVSMMVIAIVLITIGMMRSRRAKTEKKYFWSIFIFYLIAFLLILFAIPWPAGKFAGGWF
jgi:cell division protein FtsW (lipid II flippase)